MERFLTIALILALQGEVCQASLDTTCQLFLEIFAGASSKPANRKPEIEISVREVKGDIQSRGHRLIRELQRLSNRLTEMVEVHSNRVAEINSLILAPQQEAAGIRKRWETLAGAYGIADVDLVLELFRLPGLEGSQALTVLESLPEAYVGKPEAIASVIRMLHASHRPAILGNIAEGIGRRSVTETALGIRIIAGLQASNTDVRHTFLEIVRDHGSRLAPSHITSALLDITGRMQIIGSYAQAEQAFLEDFSVSPEAKASLVRVRKRMGKSQADLMKQVPTNQHPQVMASMREGTILDVFEELAKQKGRPTEDLPGTKRESFEFEALRFPASGGKFLLKSPGSGFYDNGSRRIVVLTAPFAMQAYPVTLRQWNDVMDTVKPLLRGEPDQPAMVLWEDAVAYAQQLSQFDPNYNYRLPTEAEWEVAVHTGLVTQFSRKAAQREWRQTAQTSANSGSRNHPGAKLEPDANGLYGMHKNVWEWNADWYGPTPPAGDNPQGPMSGSHRVVQRTRLDFSVDDPLFRSAGASDSTFGFRLVRTPK